MYIFICYLVIASFCGLSHNQIIRTYTHVPTTTTTTTSATALPQCEYEAYKTTIEDLGALIKILKSFNNKSSDKELTEEIISKLINALVFTSTHHKRNNHNSGAKNMVDPKGGGTLEDADIKGSSGVSGVARASDISADNFNKTINTGNTDNKSDVKNIVGVGNTGSVRNTGGVGKVGGVANGGGVGNVGGADNVVVVSNGNKNTTESTINSGRTDKKENVSKIDGNPTTGQDWSNGNGGRTGDGIENSGYHIGDDGRNISNEGSPGKPGKSNYIPTSNNKDNGHQDSKMKSDDSVKGLLNKNMANLDIAPEKVVNVNLSKSHSDDSDRKNTNESDPGKSGKSNDGRTTNNEDIGHGDSKMN